VKSQKLRWVRHEAGVGNNEFIQNVVGFEVLTAVVAMSSVFWDITLCIPLKVDIRFGGTCSLHHHGGRKSQARNQHEAGSKQGFADFLLDLYFSPEYGGNMFLRNVY
jgi:hypothetical protein